MGDNINVASLLPAATGYMPPICGLTKFAELIGLPERVVREQVSKGYWPTYGKVGKYVMINLAAIQDQCLRREALK